MGDSAPSDLVDRCQDILDAAKNQGRAERETELAKQKADKALSDMSVRICNALGWYPEVIKRLAENLIAEAEASANAVGFRRKD